MSSPEWWVAVNREKVEVGGVGVSRLNEVYDKEPGGKVYGIQDKHCSSVRRTGVMVLILTSKDWRVLCILPLRSFAGLL